MVHLTNHTITDGVDLQEYTQNARLPLEQRIPYLYCHRPLRRPIAGHPAPRSRAGAALRTSEGRGGGGMGLADWDPQACLVRHWKVWVPFHVI